MAREARFDARSILAFAGVAAGLLGLYLGPAIVSGARLPTGPDAALYAWWTNLASLDGTGVVPGRTATLALTTLLDAGIPGDALAAVAVAGPLLAMVVALAAGGLAASCVPERGAAVATAVFAGAWAGILAPSWLASLTAVACVLAGLSMLLAADGSRRRLAAGAIAFAAAGSAHAGLLPLFGVVVVAAAVVWRWTGGPRALAPAAGLFAGAALGGLGAAGLVALARPGMTVSGDTSQDAFLRRAGLRSILADRFRERLAADARRAALPALAGVLLGIRSLRTERGGPETDRDSGYRALWIAWGIVTLLAASVLAVLPRAQGNRLVALAFFVPLAAGPGLAAVARRDRRSRVLGVVAAAVLVSGAMFAWYRQPAYLGQREVRLARTVDEAVRGLPPRTPIVLLTDTREEAAGFHVTRALNVVRSQLDARRLPDLHLAVGSPRDHLRGKRTLTGDEEHDALARRLSTEVPARPTAVLVVRPFNRPGFREARALGDAVAADVVSVGRVRVGPVGLAEPRPAGMHPGARLLAALAALAVLSVVGAGWSRSLAISSSAAVALAPAAGVVIVGVAGAVGAATGLPAGAGWTVALVLSAVGWVTAARHR